MTKLHDYLTGTNTTQAALADEVGVSKGYMSSLVSGAREPSLRVAVKIERATRGAVKPSGWVAE